MSKNILLTGGGTAGHILPIIAITESLKTNHRVNLLYVGAKNGLEEEIALKNGLKFKSILVGKWRNYFSFQNFIDIFKTGIGLIQTFFIFINFRPNIVLAKGGFVTIPTVFWAKLFHIPVVIHESDVVMGKANRLASNYASRICVGFPIKYYNNVPTEKLIYTGTPINKDFLKPIDSQTDQGRKKILITGGSQGATRINEIADQIMMRLLEKYEIWHLVGVKNVEKFKNREYSNNQYYHFYGFTDKMSEIMSQVDLVISRSSANTLTEISALSKPSILLPLSSAAQDHQTANAKVFEENSAAIVLSENSLTSDSLLSIINHLIEDKKLRDLIGHHARQFAREDSVKEIIEVLFEVMK